MPSICCKSRRPAEESSGNMCFLGWMFSLKRGCIISDYSYLTGPLVASEPAIWDTVYPWDWQSIHVCSCLYRSLRYLCVPSPAHTTPRPPRARVPTHDPDRSHCDGLTRPSLTRATPRPHAILRVGRYRARCRVLCPHRESPLSAVPPPPRGAVEALSAGSPGDAGGDPL